MTIRRWRKSSRSNTETACVEVAHTRDVVRDSKNPTGPVLPVAAFAVFLSDVRSGRFDL